MEKNYSFEPLLNQLSSEELEKLIKEANTKKQKDAEALAQKRREIEQAKEEAKKKENAERQIKLREAEDKYLKTMDEYKKAKAEYFKLIEEDIKTNYINKPITGSDIFKLLF